MESSIGHAVVVNHAAIGYVESGHGSREVLREIFAHGEIESRVTGQILFPDICGARREGKADDGRARAARLERREAALQRGGHPEEAERGRAGRDKARHW